MGSGRNSSATPSATSRTFASAMLLVDALLHREADADLHPPRLHLTVLLQGGDAVDLHLGAHALDRGGGARDGEADGLLDGAGGRAGELDRLLDHGGFLLAPGVGLDHPGEAS